jgi:adenylylsulfate kinase
MPQRILIMGLPGSGKTTLAVALMNKLSARWFNADSVRKLRNDWDFSHEGRIRQATRMRELCDISSHAFTIADFVAPLQEMRDIFDADITIWVDTITESRYADTNQMFVAPTQYDFRVTEQDAEKWSDVILAYIILKGAICSL